ncbi:MAG: hypothetical protein K8R25_08225 [Methanosarcinales archaeon]|nr:hypothetical protein [Methanosarcinales archaeon]
MKVLAINSSPKMAKGNTAMILKPFLEGMREPIDDIFKAAKEAGYQLVKEGKMSIDTLKIISRELLPLEMYIQIVNQSFKAALNALKKIKS